MKTAADLLKRLFREAYGMGYIAADEEGDPNDIGVEAAFAWEVHGELWVAELEALGATSGQRPTTGSPAAIDLTREQREAIDYALTLMRLRAMSAPNPATINRAVEVLEGLLGRATGNSGETDPALFPVETWGDRDRALDLMTLHELTNPASRGGQWWTAMKVRVDEFEAANIQPTEGPPMLPTSEADEQLIDDHVAEARRIHMAIYDGDWVSGCGAYGDIEAVSDMGRVTCPDCIRLAED